MSQTQLDQQTGLEVKRLMSQVNQLKAAVDSLVNKVSAIELKLKKLK